MQETIYLRMWQRIKVSPNSLITIGDLSQVIAKNATLKTKIMNMPIYKITKNDRNMVVIDLMNVIHQIQKHYPNIEIQTIGPSQTLVEVKYVKKMMTTASFIAVWFLLFVGAGLAIMNFHEDVSMQAVHQNIYYMITGIKEEKPLLLQIPYSIGLGAGMILFFNHLFRKRLNEEPSPLEVEMFKYQQDIDQYIITSEMRESRFNDDN